MSMPRNHLKQLIFLLFSHFWSWLALRIDSSIDWLEAALFEVVVTFAELFAAEKA